MRKDELFGLHPQQVNRVLSMATDGGDPASGTRGDEIMGATIGRWLDSPLRLDSPLLGKAVASLRERELDTESFVAKRLVDVLQDPDTDPAMLHALQEHFESHSTEAHDDKEVSVAVALCLAAIASLLVYHGEMPSQYKGEDLSEPFAELASRPWVPSGCKGLFWQAHQVCRPQQKDQPRTDVPDHHNLLVRSKPKTGDAQAALDASVTASTGAQLERPGTQVGRYKLLRVLGEGGMGMVYLAEQEGEIRRKVALKVIKPGMDSARVVARFEAERQALASLDHPGVAQVYDAGTTAAGRPYFVMEYVKGSPITEYCDRHKLGIEDRLRLFQRVCHAVQHAHQKGIIHRDIKPSNILVSAEGDEAIPKIIDFGVAKAIAAPLTERTLFTEDSQLLGTPEYMSPEQAEMVNEDIDTRSDIYSLGVLLYVLLAGILPYDSKTFREGGVEHIRKMIRETDPKTPSTRLTKLGEEAAKLAASRRTEVATLAKRLHRELEWIPLKAMRRDRAERYRSASELADDIENYVTSAPLIAGPPGSIYKVKKFVRRNRALVGGVAALLAVLLAGVVVSSIFAIGQARALVDNRLITNFLQEDVLGSADEARIGEATVNFVLDAASDKLEDRFRDKPLIMASMCNTLGEVYRNLGEYGKAENHILKAIEIYQRHCGESHPDTLSAMDHIGWVYIKQGRYRDMEKLYTRIGDIRQRKYGVEPAPGGHGLAVAYYLLGKYEEAERLCDKILETANDRPGGEDSPMLPHTKINLASVYTGQGRYKEAESLFLETEENARWPATGGYAKDLANIYREQGRYGDAERVLDEALEKHYQQRGDQHLHTVVCMCGLARLHVDQGRDEEAETLIKKVLPIARQRMRGQHPEMLGLLNTYAVFLTRKGQYDEAGALFEEALKGRQRELGNDHPEALQTINDLGILRREQGQYPEAERLLTKALEGRKAKLGSDHPRTLESFHELGLLHMRQAQWEDAEQWLLNAFHGREAKLGPDHPHSRNSLKRLVTLYESWHKPDEAAKWRARLPEGDDAQE